MHRLSPAKEHPVTELERQHQIEISAAVQAYLGFMQSGMLTTPGEQPSLTVSRVETIQAFLRLHPSYHGILPLLVNQYVDAAPIVVRRQWWLEMSR
jgi:hypothetical protein